MRGPALTSSLIQRLLWAPLKPCQIWILSLCVQWARGFLGLALFSTGIFLTPLNLLRFLAVSFCDGRFSCSSDGVLLCVATRIESPIACCYDNVTLYVMIETTPSLRDVSCCLSQEHGRWSSLLVQPCGNECPGRTHGLPCSTLAGGCLPLRSSELVSRGPGRPSTSHRIFGFRVARARFFLVLSARHPVDSFIRAPLLEPGISNVENMLDGDEGVG